MTAAHEKAPAGTEAIDNNINLQIYSTTSRGRRAISSLWTTARLISGAQLSDDDLSLINEMLEEIGSMVGVAHAK